VKSIRIVTLAVPLLAGCELLSWVHVPGSAPAPTASPAVTTAPPVADAPTAAPPSVAVAPSDPMQLRPAPGLAVERDLEREDVKAENRFGDADFRAQQARALAGDREAAMRVARMYAEGSNGVPRDDRAMVLWLKRASVLDNAAASYQLYLYYLARGLDRDALRYERRAVRQGYTLPVRLDNRRG
jgi:hypothetical protein